MGEARRKYKVLLHKSEFPPRFERFSGEILAHLTSPGLERLLKSNHPRSLEEKTPPGRKSETTQASENVTSRPDQTFVVFVRATVAEM